MEDVIDNEIENFDLVSETADLRMYIDEDGYYRVYFINCNDIELEITHLYNHLLPDLETIQQKFEDDLPY